MVGATCTRGRDDGSQVLDKGQTMRVGGSEHSGVIQATVSVFLLSGHKSKTLAF